MRRIIQFIAAGLYAMGRTIFGGLHLKKKFPIVARMQELLAGKARPSIVEVNGCTFQMDVREEIDVTGGFERGTTELFRRELHPGDIVVDIGASIGAFSVLAAKRGAQVYAYDPTPRSFGLLIKNTRGCTVVAYNVAVADKKGHAELCLELAAMKEIA
ncbi:MAG: hypothetical protein RL681_113 [Candidatus Parcubacteria bacterium]|jgi:tRNA G37 N-methylase Trm5